VLSTALPLDATQANVSSTAKADLRIGGSRFTLRGRSAGLLMAMT